MENDLFPIKRIKQALGGMAFLISALFLLSPYGSLNPMGFGVIWLFGYAGYYYLLPLFLLGGGFLFVKGKGIHLLWKQILALALLFFGFGFLFGTLSYSYFQEDLSSLFETFQKGLSHAEIAYSLSYAGGVPFTSLVGVMGKGSLALPLALTIVFLLSGLILFLYEPWLGPLCHKIALKAERKKRMKESEKAIEKNGEKEDKSEISFEDIPSSFTPKEECKEPQKPLPSRSVSNLESRLSSPIIPEEVPTPFSPSFMPEEKKTSGLTAAIFNPSIPGETKVESPQEARSKTQNPTNEAPMNNFLNEDNSLHSSFDSFTPFGEPLSQVKEEPLPPKEEKESIATTLETPVSPFENLLSEDTQAPLHKEEKSFENKAKDVLESPAFEEKVPQKEAREASFETPSLANPSSTAEEKSLPEKPTQEEKPQETVMTPLVQAGGEAGHWTAPPAKPTKEALLDNLGMPHKKPLKPYKLPSVDLLKDYEPTPEAEQEKLNCERRKELINEVFNSFHVGAYVEDYTIGPSVTRYNIRTEDGVSVGSLAKYVNDISVRLKGVGVRFETIVRGRNTSGLEIPNDQTTTVSLKQMIKALPQKPGTGLYVPFGVNIDNAPIFANLADFPHLLTAGGTGSGKSVFLTGLIMSLIMRNRPEDVKLVLIDPKRVEMAKYQDLPHLLCPIVKEPAEAKVCLDKLIQEMETRYKAFETAGVKDIGEWNSEFVEDSDYAKLPYIVVFIDEYADLSDCCKNVGDSVVRLAQKARAAGIHLVIATQRPSVSVITGTIKANILVRVALSMSSAIDSQTILGSGGAEELIGHGDMLVDCGQVSRMGFTRCQGCFCNSHEINAVCDFIRSQMEPEYSATFLDLVDHEAAMQTAQDQIIPLTKSEAAARSLDSFYDEVKASVMTMEYTSISRIQRQFGVGFPRAGKLISRLQKEGIVANAPDVAGSSKGFRVLVHSDPNPQSSVTLAKDN